MDTSGSVQMDGNALEKSFYYAACLSHGGYARSHAHPIWSGSQATPSFQGMFKLIAHVLMHTIISCPLRLQVNREDLKNLRLYFRSPETPLPSR